MINNEIIGKMNIIKELKDGEDETNDILEKSNEIDEKIKYKKIIDIIKSL